MDTKRRSYDIYDIEERVHALELGGGDTPTPSSDSWDYSTTEKDTHQKWVDGQEIYCKVIEGTFNFKSATEITIVAQGDIELLVDFRAFGSYGNISPQSYITGGYVKSAHYAQFDATKVALFYTKTTPTNSAKRSKK